MSGLCGWFQGKNTDLAAAQSISAMASVLTRFDNSTVTSASASGNAVAIAVPRIGDGDICQNGEQLVAVWGRARFADAEFSAMAQRDGMARALAEGYARKGSDILATLSGSFAVAILNGPRGETILAIDRMGTRSMGYRIVGDKLVFSSTLDAIRTLPGMDLGIDHQAIYDFVYFHMVPAPNTIYSGVQRLLPGEYVSFEQRQPKKWPLLGDAFRRKRPAKRRRSEGSSS